MADTKIIIDAATGEIQEIKLTQKEITDRATADAAFQAVIAQREALAIAKTEAKVSLIDKLGITADEAALLLS